MKRRIIVFLLSISILIVSFPLNVKAASSIPVITSPLPNFLNNSNQSITIRWNAPTGTVSSYLLNVRHLSSNVNYEPTPNPQDDPHLIVKLLTLSSGTRSYTIPWSKLEYGSAYRISICAYMNDGSERWSDEIYFFTSTYKVVAHTTTSFYLYSGLPSDWKNAIYYAAQTWRGAMGLEYEVVNTYPFTQCHNNNTVILGDGLNRITWTYRDLEEQPYLMKTRIQRTSGRISEADININREYNFSTSAQSGYFDVQGIMVHEMGHASGLPHCFESFASEWTMYASSLPNDTKKRSLENGDQSLFQSLYFNI